ncbi:hypothetical protein Q1695_011422 [Nippostrongylus brasiliensis]|nr:hypothetical protein Q1695_011422 [Nippostrongylus brasiliensis]
MEEPPPFNDVKHLYVLAVCYATCATVITMDLIVFVYKRVKREGFLNSYGYGTYGMGPNNIGLDSFGFYKDKFYNSGMPPLYVHAAYRDYYHEISFHKNKYGLPAPTNYEILQQERFGPYYNGVWGHIDQSPNWFGK